jgi:hypothetical protein
MKSGPLELLKSPSSLREASADLIIIEDEPLLNLSLKLYAYHCLSFFDGNS